MYPILLLFPKVSFPSSTFFQFKLKSAPKGTQPVLASPFATAPSLEATSEDSTIPQGDSSTAPERFHSLSMGPPNILSPAVGAFPEEGRLLRTMSSDVERAVKCPEPADRAQSNVPLAAESPPSNLIERFYRQFWRRKGDVFHLLLGLAVDLDDRVWPKEDRDQVQLFISLVHHVTGVKLKAYFASEGEPLAAGLWGRLGQTSRVRGKSKYYGSRKSWAASLRRAHIRMKAHFYPYNSGTTAAEALVAPFFHIGEADDPDRGEFSHPAATLETMFPRSEKTIATGK